MLEMRFLASAGGDKTISDQVMMVGAVGGGMDKWCGCEPKRACSSDRKADGLTKPTKTLICSGTCIWTGFSVAISPQLPLMAGEA